MVAASSYHGATRPVYQSHPPTMRSGVDAHQSQAVFSRGRAAIQRAGQGGVVSCEPVSRFPVYQANSREFIANLVLVWQNPAAKRLLFK